MAEIYQSRSGGGGRTRQSSGSTTYDYSGLEEHLKRQDAISQLGGQKFAALYGGDIAGSVDAGNRIRGLLSSVRANAPGATERNPMQVTNPLVKVARADSESRETDEEGVNQYDVIPGAPAAPAEKKAHRGPGV